jgi:hypothetical protein
MVAKEVAKAAVVLAVLWDGKGAPLHLQGYYPLSLSPIH